MTITATQFMGEVDAAAMWLAGEAFTGIERHQGFATMLPDFGGAGGGGGGGTGPATGQVWPRILTTYLDADGGWTRRAAIISTGVLSVGARESGLVQLAPAYRLYRLVTSVPARVRLYVSIAKRDADVARPVSVDPGADSGLVLDYVTTSGFLGGDLSPVIDGFDDKPLPDGMIAYVVDNLDTAGAVSCTLVYLRTE